MTDLPPQVRNALEMRGLIAVPKRYFQDLQKQSQSDVYAAWRHGFRYWCGGLWRHARWALGPRNLAIELNPMTHARRRRFDEHMARHEHPSGFGHCDEAMRLFRTLPAKDQVILG